MCTCVVASYVVSACICVCSYVMCVYTCMRDVCTTKLLGQVKYKKSSTVQVINYAVARTLAVT